MISPQCAEAEYISMAHSLQTFCFAPLPNKLCHSKMSYFLRKANKQLKTCYHKPYSPLPQPQSLHKQSQCLLEDMYCFIVKCINLNITMGNLTNCTKINCNTKIFIFSNLQKGFRISLFITIY